MIKSNCKKAKANILAYVMEYAAECTAENYDTETTAENIYSRIWAKYNREYVFKNRPACQRNFIQWAEGLPLDGLFCYYYNRSAVDDVKAILEETDTEAARYTEAEAEELLSRLIYREVYNGAHKNGGSY